MSHYDYERSRKLSADDALPASFPRVPLREMDRSMLVFELDRETQRMMPGYSDLITSAATVASFLRREKTGFVGDRPLRVALQLLRWGVRDADIIAAALLHGVLEDSALELIESFGEPEESPVDCVTRLYGPRVSCLVLKATRPDLCDDESRMTYAERVQLLAEDRSLALLIEAGRLKDNAGSVKLLKHLPVVQIVADGLLDMDTVLTYHFSDAMREAARDIDGMLVDLRGLAAENDADL